ncbi:hypothetical protein C4K35_5120 [Pseudomonas chlororaphis subsp. piscium]|nr:hypothetical protein C4K35_5120 [Pseudomonas chlororaphis subsp. piscium]
MSTSSKVLRPATPQQNLDTCVGNLLLIRPNHLSRTP